MKNFFLLLICSAFSVVVSAQTLYVKNTTNNYNLDVTTIIKWPSVCNSSSNCPMVDMTGIAPGGSATQAYPTTCASVPYITLDIQYFDPSISIPQPITISFCGTPVSGIFTGSSPIVYYDLYLGVGVDIILSVHP